MQSDKEKLLAEKFMLVTQTHTAVIESNRLQDQVCELMGKQNELKIKNENLSDAVEKFRGQVSVLKQDLEVSANDKGAVEEELLRVGEARAATELDLAEVSKEKMRLEEEMQAGWLWKKSFIIHRSNKLISLFRPWKRKGKKRPRNWRSPRSGRASSSPAWPR